MQRPVFAIGLIAVASLVLCTSAGAAPIDRGSGPIHDTDRDITGVSDARTTANGALFEHPQGTDDYRSGTTDLQPNLPDAAYDMTNVGFQNAFFDLAAYSTRIIRDGDVTAIAQSGTGPEPAVVSLLLAGTGVTGVVGRRHHF